MTQALAADMKVLGLIPMDMLLLYAWAGGVGCSGLQIPAVSAWLLADHFVQVRLKLKALVPITYLHGTLHMDLSSLKI